MNKVDGYSHVEGHFPSKIDGTKIFYQSWLPAEPVKKIIFFHHGFGEHSGRYGNMIRFLNDGSTAFFGLDARGHGLSQGIRGHVDSFSDYKKDLSFFIDMVKEQYSDLPCYLLGHSMGGAVALDYALNTKNQSKLDGLILSSPALVIYLDFIKTIKILIGSNLARFFPKLVIESGLDNRLISHDLDAIRDYDQDPLVHGKISFSLGKTFYEIGESLFQKAGQMKLPVYIMHGTGDKIIDHGGSKRLYEVIGSSDRTLNFYPDLYHEIFNEKKEMRKQPLEDLKRWVEEHNG